MWLHAAKSFDKTAKILIKMAKAKNNVKKNVGKDLFTFDNAVLLALMLALIVLFKTILGSVVTFEAAEKVEKAKKYAIDEAVNLVKETSYSKFDGSLEIHINTSVKNLRGLVSLPYASGKKLKIVAFGKGAEESGADIVGDDEKLNEIAKGKIDFDFIVTDPSWMPKLARAAKVLGPRGLMPNPKNGTISDNLKKAVEEIQSGKVEYKSEKIANVVHLSLGKISQPTEELSQNIKVLLGVVGKSKIKVATIAPSMGPGVKLDTSSI